MNKNIVTILTPAYNVESKVIPYLESILNQTYKKIELIFVNDGSIDNTENIFFKYKIKFEKIGIKVKYIYQKNKGVSGAINTGLKLINGEFLTWPDADDFLEKDSIYKKVNFLLKNKSIAVVSSDAYLFNSNDLNNPVGRLAVNYPNINKKDQFQLLIEEKSIFCPGCHMVRMDLLRKVNPSLRIYEHRLGQNWQMLLPLYYHYDHGFINEPLFNYVIYNDSICHSNNETFFKRVKKELGRKKILINTINNINMDDTDKIKYQKLINKIFYKKKIGLIKSLFIK